MPYAVGHVTRFNIEFKDSRFDSKFRNILHFRGIEASMTSAQMASFLELRFLPHLFRLSTALSSTTFIRHVEVANLTDLAEPTQEQTFDSLDFSGVQDPNDDDVPQAAACVTRKSFLRGRQSIGHVYFGPLHSLFCSEGLIVPDPLGPGDLQDVLDCFGDPLLDGVTGWSARPIVCNAAGTGVVANNDVRTQTIAQKVVYLKSRRPGVGE